jgi:DNA polymerase III subunit beta
MTFSVSSSHMLKHLASISGVIGSNTLIPILENILFELKDGKLKATASDMQMVMSTEFDVESKEKGTIAVPARLLLDTLRSLPEQPVTLKVDLDTFGTELITANGRYKLAGENPIDFPKTPSVTSNMAMDMPANVLTSAIGYTVFATGNDDLRPAMAGVYLNTSPEQCTFVATDGHKLVRYSRTDITTETEASYILPKKALNLLKSSLPNDSSLVKLELSSSHAFFSFGSTTLICRLIDERYPDYNSAIPLQNPNVLTINRTEILNVLKRIAIYANKTSQQIRVKLASDSLEISAEDIDYSNEANEKLACDYEGEAIEIGFNAKFISEMLSNLSCKTINLEMSTPNRAGLIIPVEQPENENILMLVMPVMLPNYN